MSRTILIGDIHGCRDELHALLDRVGVNDDDLVVSVGDVVDRGPDPGGVIDLLRGRRSLVLMGNHERKHVRGVYSYSQLVTREQLAGRYDDDVAWMATLPYWYETPDVRVVHWGLFPGTPLAETPEDVLAGTTAGDRKLRERYGDRAWYEHYEDDVPVVFGHAVVGREPLVVRDRVYGLDTGACHGWALTALVLPERRLVSVPAREDHWATVRTAWQVPVLRSYRWPTLPFGQIDRKLRGLRDPELGDAFLDAVAAWVAGVRGAVPVLAAGLDAEVARLLAEVGDEGFGRAAAEHPAASTLQRRRAGKLSTEHLGCDTPAQVFALADALGLALSVPREP